MKSLRVLARVVVIALASGPPAGSTERPLDERAVIDVPSHGILFARGDAIHEGDTVFLVRLRLGGREYEAEVEDGKTVRYWRFRSVVYPFRDPWNIFMGRFEGGHLVSGYFLPSA